MDRRYTKTEDDKEFHKKRTAFVIINGKIDFIKNSEMSHWEYCEKLGFSKEEFNTFTRGYFLNGDLVFYKNNFIFDENVIKEGLQFIDVIKKECNTEKIKVYFGLKVDLTKKVWPFDYYYGLM